MDYLPHILAVLGIWAVVVVTPGPNFLVITHHALARSRKAGIFCAAGVAAGTFVWAASALFGLALIVGHASWAYNAIRIGGAIYLIYVGLRALFGGASLGPAPSAVIATGGGLFKSFRAGLFVDLSNPKAATFFTSLFVVMLPAGMPLWMGMTTVVVVVTIAGAWYAATAIIVSMPAVARAYKKIHRWIDRLAGALFVFFGGKLLLGR
jgi:threonine efflux protein